MEPPWSEFESEGSLTICFDGIDAQQRDASELEAFRSNLKTPAREDEAFGAAGSPLVFDRRPTRSPTAGIFAMVLAGAGAVLGYAMMESGRLLVEGLAGPAMIALFVIGLLTPSAIMIARQRKLRPAKPTVRQRFTLRLDASGFHVAGAGSAARTFGLSAIDGFEGGRRLAVRLRDGEREELVCSLPVASKHIALAGRLDAALTTARAALGGYRGERVRVETRPLEDERDEESADAETPRGRSSVK